MTYQIYLPKENDYCRYPVLFDIEFYQIQLKNDPERWASEIHVLPIVEGLFKFFETIRDNDGFNSEEFIKDAEEIQELRRWLYEVNGNRFHPTMTASNEHYHVRGKYIKEKINAFAKKYGLAVKVD